MGETVKKARVGDSLAFVLANTMLLKRHRGV